MSRRATDATDPRNSDNAGFGPRSNNQAFQRGLWWLVHPAFLLTLTLVVHVFARAASFNHYHKLDSYTYAVSAYRMWRADASFADLVPDKPPGQALLTGWIFHLFSEPPTRLMLIPVESAFLLAAYAVFWCIARRVLSGAQAAAMTLFFAIAHNVFNVLDFTTDGFNLGESYLAFPVLLSVWAHLSARRPSVRGLGQGLAIGTALTIKQSALGIGMVLCAHEFWRHRRDLPRAFLPVICTVLGIALAMLPSVIFLLARGWLAGHVENLLRFTGVHGQASVPSIPAWYNVEPLLPSLFWITLGVLGMLPTFSRSAERHAVDALPQGEKGPCGLWSLVVCWFAVELLILAAMTKPSSHYYQQIAAPCVLLGGLAWKSFLQRVSRADGREQAGMLTWSGVTVAVLAFVAAGPVFTEASRRIPTFDHRREIEDFQARLQTQPVVGARLPENENP
jgi:hypothetical protein